MARKDRRKAFARRLAAVGMALAFGAGPACANDILDDQTYQIRNLYGEVGLIDMPGAHMADDGQITVSVSALKDTQRYGFSFQALPWLEGSFRYSHLNGLFGSNYYDRSFGVKLRLFEETADTPDISLGVRDIIGTGIYGSEYLVASKHIFSDFDVTAGMGWGRLANSETFSNPFGAIFSSFKVRPPPNNTGQIDFGQLFHGPDIGLFGGVVWHTPIRNLDFIVEYSSDRYKQEKIDGLLNERIPLNFGLAYRPLNHIALGAGFLYGDTYGLSLTIDTDPTKPLQPSRLGVQPPPVATRTPEQQEAAIVSLSKRNVIAPQRSADKPWLGPQYAQGDDLNALSDALAGVSDRVEDYEIDGYTLLVNVREPATANQCQSYARLPALSNINLKSVAVTDLGKGNGQVVTCSVPRPGVQLASSATPLGNMYSDADDAPAPLPRRIPDEETERTIRKDAHDQALYVDAVRQGRGEMWIYFTNHHYYLEAEAVGRLTRIAMKDAPPDIEEFHLISVEHGVPLRQTQVLRSPLERVLLANGGVPELQDAIEVTPAPMDNPTFDSADLHNYPRLSWAISPETKQSLFDPDLPLQAQLLVAVKSGIDLFPGVTLASEFDINIYNNFTDNRPSFSMLPHVRSDIQKYYKHGINGIANFEVDYRARLAPDVFTKVEAGYLEDMFGGAGAQVVWRPEASRLVLGADIYEVWQRNYDRLLGFLPYHVLTGHLNIYYESPWSGLNFNLHVGRYLAGDYGGTFEVVRHFDSGVEIGAFATFTNVPFKEFGEGSFDKGVMVRIPLEWALPIHSQSAYNLQLRPIQADGGQRLENDDSLYDETRRTGYGEFAQHLDDIPNP